MKNRLSSLIEEALSELPVWHYTAAIRPIIKSGKLRGRRISLTTIQPSEPDKVMSLQSQGVNAYYGIEIDTTGLDLEEFTYNPKDAGSSYQNLDWRDEQELVSLSEIPVNRFKQIWVNPALCEYAASFIPSSLFRKVGTPAAKMLAAVEYANSPRPSSGDTLEAVKAAIQLVAGDIPVV